MVGSMSRSHDEITTAWLPVHSRQGLVQIGDTLTENGVARVDTHVGAGQTRLYKSGSIGALGSTRRQQCGKRAN